jgi:diaminopimelate decarboxylase
VKPVLDFGRLAAVSTTVQTPFYVYHADAAREACYRLRQGLLEWGSADMAFSVKTNPLFHLLRDLRSTGSWVEVVSDHEFRLARLAGYEPATIIYNGPLKAGGVSAETVAAACINIDTIAEVTVLERAGAERGHSVAVGLRICPPLTSPTWSRFGLNLEEGEVHEAMDLIRSSRILQFRAIHCHLGTQVIDTRLFAESIRFLRSLWGELRIPGHVWLDIGGGLPYEHSQCSDNQPLDPTTLFRTLAALWGSPRPHLIIEPGRYVAAPSLTAVGRVIATKKRPREPLIIVLDLGTNHNVMGAFFDHLWEFSVVEDSIQQYRVCGPLCMEDDVMSGETRGPVPRIGALAAMHNAGAYSLSLARNFIQPIPAVVELGESSHTVLLDRGCFESAFGAP